MTGPAGRPASSVDQADTGSPAAYHDEVDSAVREERRVAVKALIALAIVAVVIGLRLWFFG
jgi:hypothetical protein